MKKAVAAGTEPVDSAERALFAQMSGKKAPTDVERAFDIHEEFYKREVMESFLLAEATPQEIEDVLRVSVPITEAYMHLFFDLDVFEDELDRLNYAYTYDKNDFGAKLKKFAVDMGKESLMVRMSRGSYVVPSSSVQESVRSTAFMLSQLAKTNNASSATAKEAYRWAQLALKAAVEDDTQDQGNVDRVVMELETVDETTNEETSGIDKVDILH